MTRARICAAGYRTATYRPPSSQTTHAKWYVVEPAYGQRHVAGELDHLVPLELGGSNDMKNFWVETGRIPNPKDTVENRLHREVCTGKISLHTAQLDLAHNWTTAP
jgi:5-methylcytosine-specific restriction endonuclease McrA